MMWFSRKKGDDKVGQKVYDKESGKSGKLVRDEEGHKIYVKGELFPTKVKEDEVELIN